MISRRMGGIVLAAAISAACAAIADFDALQPVDPTAPDGDAPDVALPVGDGGGDAAADVMVTPPDGDVPSPCLAPHTFCDDFTSGVIDVATKWRINEGNASIVDASFVTKPFAVRMIPADGNTESRSYIGLELLPTSAATITGRVRVQFDWRVNAPSPFLLAEILTTGDDGGSSGSVQLVGSDSVLTLGMNWPNGGTDSRAMNALPNGWRHADVYFNISEDGGAVRSGFDAAAVSPITNSAIPPAIRITIDIGVRNHAAGDIPEVLIDDVVVDVEP